MRIGRHLAAILLPMLLALPAMATDARLVDLREMAAPGVSHADLVRRIVPDLAADGAHYRGSTLIALRHVAGDGWGGATPEPFIVDSVPVVAFEEGGIDRFLLLLDLGHYSDYAEGLAALALFERGGTPRLVDVVDVAYDSSVVFDTPPMIEAPSGQRVFVVRSTHSNSNQAYVTHVLLTSDGDRLNALDTVFTFSEHSCAGELKQTPRFSFGSGEPGLEPLLVSVNIETIAGEDDCGEEAHLAPSRRTVTVAYRRPAPGEPNVPDSDSLRRLAEENEGRF